MAKQEYFQSALADFAFDMASGSAIRHLADLGHTGTEIIKMLDFPTPYDRIVKTMRKHFLDTGVLLLEEPGQGNPHESYTYVTEYDRYSHKSFRRVATTAKDTPCLPLKTHPYQQKPDGRLQDFLASRCAQNKEASAYVSCDFGLLRGREPQHFQQILQLLSLRQQDYVQEIFGERKRVYHRLNQCMREIVSVLYEHGEYQGTCYFLALGEKVTLSQPQTGS